MAKIKRLRKEDVVLMNRTNDMVKTANDHWQFVTSHISQVYNLGPQDIVDGLGNITYGPIPVPPSEDEDKTNPSQPPPPQLVKP